MIRFDAYSIYNRLLTKIQQDPNWKAISNNSVISAILNSNAEVGAEIARYAEYLFKESKWDTAQNTSSILAMANVLGYQPQRKISATGIIMASIDPKIHAVGRTIQSRILDSNLSNNEKVELGLDKWEKPIGSEFYISSDAIIEDERGIKYIAKPSVYKSIDSFIPLDVIQGEKRSIFIDIDTIRNTSTSSELDPYIYIPVTIKDCENAKSDVSSPYFTVSLVRKSGSSVPIYEKYRVVSTLLLSSPSDKDVEVYNDFYSQNLFYLKFNKDSSRGNYLNISRTSDLLGIQINYIKTLGAKGNLINNFERFSIINPIGENGVESPYTKLYGINKEAIIGGKDEESIIDIKRNAPKFYIRNYTIGTKEAYENTILNLTISAGNQVLVPSKVNVYAGIDTGSNKPVTCVSFIAPGLDDLVLNSNWENTKKEIEESLNLLLSKLKSPQDVIQFRPPEYISIATSIKIKISRDNAKDLIVLKKEVQDYVNSVWGPNSSELSFKRQFTCAGLNKDLSIKFKNLKGFESSVTLEAVKKLDWNTAQLIKTNKVPLSQQENISSSETKDASGVEATTATNIPSSISNVHTIRIKYKFGREFLGSSDKIGFKDISNKSHKCLVRIDLMYKKPIRLGTNANYNTSIFMEDSLSRFYQQEADTNNITEINPITGIYCIRDKGSTSDKTNLWDESKFGQPGDYGELLPRKTDNTDIDAAENIVVKSDKSYQCSMTKANKVLDENDYDKLIEADTGEALDHLTHLGTIDNYIIYFKSNYMGKTDSIAEGWFECDFDSLYDILAKFALYDSVLRSSLQKIQLSNLKCGQDNGAAFIEFKKILNSYVDIYVSLQPKSDEVNILKSDDALDNDVEYSEENHKVIYIDSYDSSTVNTSLYGSQLVNLSSQKLERMLNVTCEHV